MKKLLVLSMFFFLFTGCEKDDWAEENDLQLPNLAAEFSQKASAKEVMVPLKGEIIEIADLTYGTLDCGIPNYYPPAHYDDVSGSLTHLGNVEGGFANLFNCRMTIKDGMPFLLVDATGQFKSADGDILTYEGHLWFSMTDPSLSTSAFIITGGTGRWEHSTGHFAAFFQPIDDSSLIFSVNGYVTPPGKNK